jgi:hypothetical protein
MPVIRSKRVEHVFYASRMEIPQFTRIPDGRVVRFELGKDRYVDVRVDDRGQLDISGHEAGKSGALVVAPLTAKRVAVRLASNV